MSCCTAGKAAGRTCIRRELSHHGVAVTTGAANTGDDAVALDSSMASHGMVRTNILHKVLNSEKEFNANIDHALVVIIS